MSPLGLGSNPEDKELFNLPQEEKNKLIRSQALGDALGMAAPAGVGMMFSRNLRSPSNIKATIENLLSSRTDEGVKDIASHYAKKFPRTLSHTMSIEDVSGAPFAGASMGNPVNAGGAFNEVRFNSKALEDPFSRLETGGHEFAHQAQVHKLSKQDPVTKRVDVDKAQDAYDNLDDIVSYFRNPMEREARVTGLNQANRAVRDVKKAEQPLLPGVMTNKNIRKWSEAIADDLGRNQGRQVELAANSPRADSRDPYSFGPTFIKDLQDMQKEASLRRFGSSPAGKQPRLPLDTTAPGGAEFTAVGDEPPAIRPTFKSPEVDPNYRGRKPAFAMPDIANLLTSALLDVWAKKQ